jgi:hypothetical protein
MVSDCVSNELIVNGLSKLTTHVKSEGIIEARSALNVLNMVDRINIVARRLLLI